jgi:hypothetical protein
VLYFARVADRVRDLFDRSGIQRSAWPEPNLSRGLIWPFNAFLKVAASLIEARMKRIDQTRV